MDEKILSPGTWINSCLVGLNSYEVASGTLSLLEEDPVDKNVASIIRSGTEHKYQTVKSNASNTPYWMFPVSLGAYRNRFLQIVENLHISELGKTNFFWPVDVVSNSEGYQGLLYYPVIDARYKPVRSYLANPSIPKLDLAISLFQRMAELEDMGLALNGFHREQVRVDSIQNTISIWPLETIMPRDEIVVPSQKGFLSLPDALLQNELNKNRMTADKLDLFSAAVLAFYLLYYTHPFVGKSFWGDGPEYYSSKYHSYPVYVFDSTKSDVNDVGNTDFAQIMLEEWENTVPELQQQFSYLFMELCYPGTYPTSDIWDINCWLDLLKRQKGQRPVFRADYDEKSIANLLYIIKHYRV